MKFDQVISAVAYTVGLILGGYGFGYIYGQIATVLAGPILFLLTVFVLLGSTMVVSKWADKTRRRRNLDYILQHQRWDIERRINQGHNPEPY